MPSKNQSHGTSSTTIRSTTIITNEGTGVQLDANALANTDDITRM